MESPQTKADEIDRALAALQEQIAEARPTPRRRRRFTVGGFLRGAAISVVMLLLPFLLLVKISVAIYLDSALNPWIALGISAAIATLLLTVATTLISYRVLKRFAATAFTFRSIGLLVAVYCLYSVLFLSGANLKSAEVAETYRSLHPLLRLSVSTLVIVDDELMVTDAGRRPEDYVAMGLPVNEGSLHFEQSTGYVHAVDLRTIGRTDLRNRLVAWYFRAMGFRTLRHVGTADHLHVSLPVR